MNASERKTRSGYSACASRISQAQNAIGFVCGLSTRKIRIPWRGPPEDEVEEGSPEALPVLRVEVEVVDVLVALGRVLGVLEGAVGPALEPLGVLLEPRVVGRGLEREVERDLEAVLRRGRDEVLEVGHRSELGRDGLVPAFGGADRPGAPRVVRPRGERVVPALAVRLVRLGGSA